MTADDYKSMFTGGKPVDLERKLKEEKEKEEASKTEEPEGTAETGSAEGGEEEKSSFTL